MVEIIFDIGDSILLRRVMRGFKPSSTQASTSNRRLSGSYILAKLRRARTRPASDFTTSVEDYLEVIYELVQEKGYARPVDISTYLGVKSSSVTGMLQKLHRMGFVVYERYRGITLTSKGKRLARSVKERHLVITRFLRSLGVDEDTASSDAEGIEHHLHQKTISCIKRFVDSVARNPDWFKSFSRSPKKSHR